MPPVVVLTSDNRRQSVSGGFDTDYIDLNPASGVTPSSGHTKARLAYDVTAGPGGSIYLYLPNGESFTLFDNLSPIARVDSTGLTVYSGHVKNVDVIEPSSGGGDYTHLSGGLYVGDTNSPENPGSQMLGTHYGTRDGYINGLGGTITEKVANYNDTYLDHPFLASAENLTGIVEVTVGAGKWAEFLIQGGGSGSGTCVITLLRDYSAGALGVEGAGTSHELRYHIGKVRLYSSGGTLNKISIRPRVTKHG